MPGAARLGHNESLLSSYGPGLIEHTYIVIVSNTEAACSLNAKEVRGKRPS